MTSPLPIYSKIETLRRREGLTERALARKLGFDESALAQARKRGSVPGPEIVKLIADHFNVGVALLTDDAIQLPFVEYLQGVRDDRKRVEEAYPGNVPAQMHAQDNLQLQRIQIANAAKLRQTIAALADIAYGLDPSDARLHKIARDMRKEPRRTKQREGPLVPVTLPSQTQDLSSKTGQPIPPPAKPARSA